MLCPSCATSNISKALTCRSCDASLQASASANNNANTNAPAPLHLAVGTKLQGGRFTTGKMVQQRGFDVTYLGGDAGAQRLVIIQELFPVGSTRRNSIVLPSGQWTTPAFNESKRQFIQEGKQLSGLNHPGIARTLGIFEENNTAYLVQEHPQGKSLTALLQERGKPLSEPEAISYVEKISDALSTVHKAGLVHRSICPDNVQMHQDRVVLTHFLLGCTSMVSASDHAIVGKFISRYAAPEHYGAQTQLTTSADIYSLAAILYHLLTGTAPIAATARSKGVPLKSVSQLNQNVSVRLARIVMKGLAMEARHRPGHVLEWLDLLRDRHYAFADTYEVPPVSAVAPASVAPQPAKPSTATLQNHIVHVAPAPISITTPVTSFRPVSATLHKLVGYSGRVTSVAFSPIGNLLASCGEEGATLVWDARLGTLLRILPESLSQLTGTLKESVPRSLNETLALAQTVQRTVKSSMKAYECRVGAVSFSPDGRFLATGSEDGTVIVWNVQTGKVQHTLKGHVGRVVAVAFAPQGDILASASNDSSIILWDTLQGKLTLRMTDYPGVTSVAFSPDGQIMATGSYENGVLLWQRPAHKILRHLHAPGHEVTALAFSPRNRMLTSVGYDKIAHLWDTESKQSLWTLKGHLGGITSVAFAPDGHTLATGSYDKTVRLWDALNGNLMLTLNEHEGGVSSVAFAPDGKRLASGAGAEVCLWHFA